MNIELKIKNLKIWKNEITILPIDGGITNQNFLVTDGSKKYFARLGKDIEEHLVYRKNEILVSNAVASAGIAPKIIYSTDGIIIFEYIKSTTYNPDLVNQNIDKVIQIIKKIHYETSNFLYGSPPFFWVFYVISQYRNFLKENSSPYINLLDELINKSHKLDKIAQPYDIVFCHNDLLSSNFIEDEDKIWVVDWEYAGFNTPLFDLGGLSSNNNFSYKNEIYLLENYNDTKINDQYLRKYLAIKCASLLRETMWSMVSEITSDINFDYQSYTNENLKKFEEEYNKVKS